MRVYHFTKAMHALSSVKDRRIKISTIHELNDPFEFACIDTGEVSLRKTVRAYRENLGSRFGMLCFSRSWRNPVLWAHYADRHRGICLGFDVDDTRLMEVIYSPERIAFEPSIHMPDGKIDETFARTVVSTKYEMWSYEEEVRAYVDLQDKDPATGLYFFNFEDGLTLREVIVGADSDCSRADVVEAVAGLLPRPDYFKVRPGFRTFEMCRQQKRSAWK